MTVARWLPWPCLAAAIATGWHLAPQRPCHHHRYAVLVTRPAPAVPAERRG